ncbi:hypothetical protein [Streptomyces graminilatus]|uniref:hypothetical protein n=1 Tax=Streptomyces graminilatus TaxID=1464070 RepID=UPI0006E2AAC6|nr:hypothetical protein [Streptomyces graminilatus]
MTSPPPGTVFRLHLRHRVFDGWIEPGGQAVAIEDPEYGLTTCAPTVEDPLRGYGGGHITWPDQHHEPPQQHEREPSDRDR